MREIKFRAWDKKQKKMLYGVSIGTIKVWDENAPFLSNEFSYSEDCIFEQYTGLKDKNGKEIYEGDIVKYSFINPKRTYIEPVSFGPIQDGEGYYHQEFLAWRTTFTDDGLDHSSLLDLVEPNWDCEVIGNIHENPELLEEE